MKGHNLSLQENISLASSFQIKTFHAWLLLREKMSWPWQTGIIQTSSTLAKLTSDSRMNFSPKTHKSANTPVNVAGGEAEMQHAALNEDLP